MLFCENMPNWVWIVLGCGFGVSGWFSSFKFQVSAIRNRISKIKNPKSYIRHQKIRHQKIEDRASQIKDHT